MTKITNLYFLSHPLFEQFCIVAQILFNFFEIFCCLLILIQNHFWLFFRHIFFAVWSVFLFCNKINLNFPLQPENMLWFHFFVSIILEADIKIINAASFFSASSNRLYSFFIVFLLNFSFESHARGCITTVFVTKYTNDVTIFYIWFEYNNQRRLEFYFYFWYNI